MYAPKTVKHSDFIQSILSDNDLLSSSYSEEHECSQDTLIFNTLINYFKY